MPANLTQQYKKAEEKYRQAQTPDEELKWLQIKCPSIPRANRIATLCALLYSHQWKAYWKKSD